MGVSIVTRAIYRDTGVEYEGKDDERDWGKGGLLTSERLVKLEENYIPSLKRQTDSKFKVHIIVGEEVSCLKRMNWRGLDVEFIGSEGKGFRYAADKLIPRSTIQIRMDTDDRVTPGWISSIKSIAERESDDNLVISYRPFIEGPDGRLSYHKLYHKKDILSNFLALVQKKDKKYHVYQKDHNAMGRYGKVIRVNEGYCFLNIHSCNRSSHKWSRKLRLENY